MLLTDARRRARTDAAGELIPLPEQDRALWDQALIAEGRFVARTRHEQGVCRRVPAPGRHRRLHDQARRADDTDWPQIYALYGLLERMTGNPVVTLNRAVAAAMAHGPSAGLALLDEVDERLDGHYRVDAVRAHLLEMAGDPDAALVHYRAAASRTTSVPEQHYLAKQVSRITSRQ